MESALPAAGFLYWVGAGTVAYLALRISYSLFTAFQVWGLGHGPGVGPELGEWAGSGRNRLSDIPRGVRGCKKVQARPRDPTGARSGRVPGRIQPISLSPDPLDPSNKLTYRSECLPPGVITGSTDGIGKSYAEELAKCGMKVVLISRSQDKLNEVSREIKQVKVKMTHLVLPGMVERSKGVILNISSASGMNPVPMLTIYSATKGFVDFFSQCIHEEYKSKGIFVQSVLPFFVATKLAKIRKPSLTVPSSEAYVKSAMKTVGLKTRTNGYPIHSLMGTIVCMLPPSLYLKLAMHMGKSTRARYLKKAKKN
ncbi:Estradiol 17-beta-dehydrogenase 12 [Myotis davidii]|uniref:Very-long-chain 3-oxoacyl-CoA reductase n=1 Tax=Myotis davidii TaxID=225400 RepID=L5LCN8_MYODS|nr:Estradiol 17-beta-dehydrogenase 12 [Myotis davidii]